MKRSLIKHFQPPEYQVIIAVSNMVLHISVVPARQSYENVASRPLYSLDEGCNYDAFVKSHKTPSPLMGDGRGEGECNAISVTYIPSPLSPPARGGEIRLLTNASQMNYPAASSGA